MSDCHALRRLMAPAAAMPTTYLDGFNAHASVEADMNHHNNHIHRPHTLDALDTMTRKRKSMVWTLELDQLLSNAVASLGDHEDTWSSIYHYMCEHLIQSGITPNDPMYILDVLSPMECQIRWNALRSNGSSSGSMLGGLGQGVASKRRISSVHHQHDSSLKSINASNVNANANNVNVNVGSRNNSSNKNADKNYVTWTEEEESQLIRMVEEALHSETNLEYTKIVSIGSDKVRTISWTNIAKAMNRSLEEINHMWTKMRLAKFKHGAYSAEEDRLIITRVREWYSQPEEIRPKSGLWVSLEKELNREDKRISERWRSILSKRVTFTIQESVSSHSLLSEPSSSKVKRPRKDHLNSTNCNSSNNHHRSTSNSNGNIGFDSSGQHTLSHSSHHPLHTQQHVLSIAGTTIGSSSFPSHPSIAIDNYGMLIENSHKGKDRNHKNNKNHHHNNSIEMIPLVDETGYEFEVMDKPESIRWNEEMDRLLREGISLHGMNWGKVADFINTNTEIPKGRVDDAKCRGRYYRNLRKESQEQFR